MANFFVGQKVVCVSYYNRSRRRHPRIAFPEFEQVYTVRAFCDNGPVQGLLLVEIRNPRKVRFAVTGTIAEPSFRADTFRPVVERKTDISIFTAMLNPAKIEACV